jgi:hypothetical protein
MAGGDHDKAYCLHVRCFQHRHTPRRLRCTPTRAGCRSAPLPKHIRAVVVMSDGNDTTTSISSLQNVMDEIGLQNEQGGNAVKLFTIAYGDDADGDVLKNLAEATGGKLYFGKPETINDVYGDIATYRKVSNTASNLEAELKLLDHQIERAVDQRAKKTYEEARDSLLVRIEQARNTNAQLDRVEAFLATVVNNMSSIFTQIVSLQSMRLNDVKTQAQLIETSLKQETSEVQVFDTA